MNILLQVIANFITEHWFLTFLILISIFQVRIDIGKKKDNNEKQKSKDEKEKPL